MAKKKLPAPDGPRKWRERKGSGVIRTWQPGMTVEGRFRDWKPGKYGKLFVLETAQGEETFSTPAILLDRLLGIEVGALLSIECVGKTKVKSGEAWDFKVMEGVDDDGEADHADLAS